MAYAVKYVFTFQSVGGTTREIRILKDGYSGDPIRRALGRAPILKKQQNGPVHGTSLEMYAECHVDQEFIEFYTSDPKEYRVDLYAGNALLWQGWITPELYSEPDIAPPYDVQVIATDGVGELKLYDFAAQGMVSLRAMLTYLLGKTGLSTDVFLVSSLKAGSAGAGALLDMEANFDYLVGKTCYEALSYLLTTLHATITWWGGHWLLVRENNVTFTSGKVRYFNTAGNSALLANSVQELGSMYQDPAWPVGQLSTVIDPAKNKIVVQAPWHPVTALENSDMTQDSDWGKSLVTYDSSKGAYFFPRDVITPGELYQGVAFGGLRVPLRLAMSGCGTSETGSGFLGQGNGWLGLVLRYVDGSNNVYYLGTDSDGNRRWEQATPGQAPVRAFKQDLLSVDVDRENADRIELDIPALAVGGTFPAGTLTVSIFGGAAYIFSAQLDVILNKGYQDILHIDNGARGEGDDTEVAIGRVTSDIAYYQAFVQGILFNNGSLITAFSDANFTTGMDFLSFISRDYARSVALPRARVEGTVSLEASVQLPPLVFTKGGMDYWLETWSWNLYEDELQISARTLPTATLTVESETITEAGGTASTGSSAGGASSTPVPQVAPNYFEKDGTFVTGIKLKDEFDAVRVPGLRFGAGVSEPDLYVDTVEDTQGNPVRVLRSPLALITKGDQILEDGEPLSDTGGGGGGTNLTGYISVPNIASLPDPGLPTLGYLVGTNLYVYVGNGGDTRGGKYKNCGPFRGPQGNSGYTGAAGELEVVNNLTEGGETAALSAEQGKILKGLLDEGFLYCGKAVLTPTPTNPGTPAGKVCYIATEPGTYTNFGDIVINAGEVAIIKRSGTSWIKEVTGAASADELLQRTHKIAANAILLRGLNASQRLGGAIGSTGKWQNLDTARHIIIPVSPGDVVLVNPATATYAAAVTEYVEPKNGESLLYSSNPLFSARLALSHSVANTYTMPADAKYFVLVVAGSSGVEISINALMLNSDNLLISQAQGDSQQNAVILDAARSNPICLSIPGLRDEPGIIDANGKWAQVASANYAHVTIPLKGGQAIRLKAGSRDTQFAFVRSYVTPTTNGESVDFSAAAGYTGRILLTSGTSANHTVPADAVALVLMTIANGSRMVAEFTIDGFDVMSSVPKHISSISDGLSMTSGLVLDVVDKLSVPVLVSLPYVSSLMYDGEKFVSGVEARRVHYLQCADYTFLEMRGELLNETRPIYYGYSDAVPAADGTMVVLGIIAAADTFSIKAIIPAGKYFCFAENSSYTRNIAFYKYQLNAGGASNSLAAFYDDRILDTVYSALTSQPNSLYFYQQMFAAGFRAFKADMRLTSDNKIVLCHDAGFTLDGNGRITTFDSENYTPIHNLTLAQVQALEFAEQAGGNYIHPGTLDEFLVFCKRNRCVPYLTFRNEYIADTATALWASLSTYKMEQKAIINLYPLNVNIIQALQAKQLNWLICNTRQTTIPLTQELIDETALNGCSYLCIYQDMRSSITPALVQYAASKNVRIWVCGFPTEVDLAAGVTGFQDFHQYPIV